MNISSYFILAFLWLIYFFLHSFLASKAVKQRLQRALGKYDKYYRLFYAIFAFASLLPVLLYNAQLSSKILIPGNTAGIVKIAGMITATYGVIVIRLAFKHYSIQKFLGLKQVESARSEPFQDESLQTEGILQYIRHPLYAGTILILTGFWLFSPTLANLITVTMAIIYILIGIQLEEAKLIRMYGNQYEEYKKRVPMLIPSFRPK